MPERPATIRVDASTVQGEEAYIEFKRLTWGERKRVREEVQKLDGGDLLDYFKNFIIEHVADWNWVDENGEALPRLADPGDFERLMDDETEFLFDVASGAVRGELSLKNWEKKS